MKKLALSLLCIFSVFLIACTEDETIEEQVYRQEHPENNTWASGEEGHDGTDNKKD